MTTRQCSKLRGVQYKMLQKMLGQRPAPGQPVDLYMEQINSRIKRVKGLYNVLNWDTWYHRAVFEWAGHVARISQYDESRLTPQVLAHRHWHWIQSIAAANRGSQLHGKRFRTWRWERPLYKFFENDRWETAAQHKAEWHDQLDTMMIWRQQNR